MIHKIEDDIWFDSDNLYIIIGEHKKFLYEDSLKHSPCKPKTKSKNAKYPTIVFLSSTACNLECGYCFADGGTYKKSEKKRFFDYESYVYVYEETLKQYGGVSTISFFGGEPLLNFKEIKNFVEFIYQNYSMNLPHFGISSNGTIFNDEIKEFLHKYNDNMALGTSLDGIKAHNDLSRFGKGIDSVYDKVMDTLANLDEIGLRNSVQITLNKIHIEKYKSGDIVQWINHIENSGVEFYELITVISDDTRYAIDLYSEDIYQKFVLMTSEYCDYVLENLKTGKRLPSSNIFAGTILRIIKREFKDSCTAGFSFCVTPELNAYPCHMCADDLSCSVKFDEKFKNNISSSELFNNMNSCNKDLVVPCKTCIAKHLCPYFCKSLCINNDLRPDMVRCLFMKIILKKIIAFMANDYEDNRECIKAVILEKHEKTYL